MSEYMATIALLGLWITVGVIVLILQRDRKVRKARMAEIERRLAVWVEAEQKKGTPPEEILEGRDARRLEIAQELKRSSR